ncbi:MAG: glycosyltransferase family 2 protein [Ekhidna sp.]|nr:glycosyltransferase family 2 protein [Ekhidna sp.]
MNNPLLSVIMPVFNGEKYIAAAIQSVLNQSYDNLELLIINDGSTDSSQEVISTFDDSRIRCFQQENNGVSAARNVGLAALSGEYLVCLDADDMLTEDSIQLRMNVFAEQPDIAFVDGAVEKVNASGTTLLSRWTPKYYGNPLNDLLNLTGHSFFGPSWMVRSELIKGVRFREEMTHAEDLLFYLELSRGARNTYKCISEVTLKYRVHASSAMRGSLHKQEAGYQRILTEIQDWTELSKEAKRNFRRKTASIMFKSYISNGEISNAIKILNQNKQSLSIKDLLIKS